jgi:DNA-binding transcriptional ArsR family regulator
MDDLRIADIAALVADGSRARTLLALMDGRSLPAGELALLSNVSPATMSAHLSKMVGGGLLKVESQGKHRYYRLAGPKVASLIEAFSTLVPLPPRPASLGTGPTGAMRFARTCYRHMGGQLAVEVNLAAQKRKLWTASRTKEYELTREGALWLADLGIPMDKAFQKQGFARACLDWSERRYHVAGVLGTLLLDRFLELKWIMRTSRPRAVRLTIEGRAGLLRILGLQLSTADAYRRS